MSERGQGLQLMIIAGSRLRSCSRWRSSKQTRKSRGRRRPWKGDPRYRPCRHPDGGRSSIGCRLVDLQLLYALHDFIKNIRNTLAGIDLAGIWQFWDPALSFERAQRYRRTLGVSIGSPMGRLRTEASSGTTNEHRFRTCISFGVSAWV